MKTRVMWLIFGLAFFITLAVFVGLRLSAEAMAVIVGVVAGVAASIPTSLIVVWIATRTAGVRSEPLSRPAPEGFHGDQRIVVLSPPTAGPASYAPAAPMTIASYLPPRRFTVIGGSEILADGAPLPQEVVWPQ